MDSEFNSPPTGEFPIGGSILYSTGVHTQTNFSMLDCSVTDNGAVGQELGIDSRGGCFLLENGSEVMIELNRTHLIGCQAGKGSLSYVGSGADLESLNVGGSNSGLNPAEGLGG